MDTAVLVQTQLRHAEHDAFRRHPAGERRACHLELRSGVVVRVLPGAEGHDAPELGLDVARPHADHREVDDAGGRLQRHGEQEQVAVVADEDAHLILIPHSDVEGGPVAELGGGPAVIGEEMAEVRRGRWSAAEAAAAHGAEAWLIMGACRFVLLLLVVAGLHGAAIPGVGARNLHRSKDFIHGVAAVVVAFAGAGVAFLPVWELGEAG